MTDYDGVDQQGSAGIADPHSGNPVGHSQHPVGHSEIPVAHERAQPAEEHRFRWYTLIVLTIAVVGVIAVSLWLPFAYSTEVLWTGLALTAAFLLAEQLAINVDVRSGVSWTISFTEIPLVIGLMIGQFEVVLAAHLIAGVGTLLARKVTGRVLYNAGVMAIEITVAFAIAGLVTSLISAGGMQWAAALLGTVSAPVTSTILALCAVWVLSRRMRASTGTRLMARILVVGFINASVGLSGYLIITDVDDAWPLVFAVAGGLAALYWAYSDLLREQRDLEALIDVSLLVARSGRHAAAKPASDPDDLAHEFAASEWHVLGERIKDQLAARRVVLRLRLDGSDTTHTVAVGDPPAAHAPENLDDSVSRLPGTHARHFRITEATADVRAALRARGAEELLVVPLRSANQWLGVLEAHDRLSRWRGFGSADVQLIGMMAAHLATALDNRRLTATLRHDAYHDPLTGLLNRPGFCQSARGPLEERPGTVAIRVDLDVFSTVSDALGYAWADRMLVVAGRRMRDALGDRVPVARLEGASFAALLTECEQPQAHAVAERLRAELSAPYAVDKITVEANAAVGYASVDVEQGTGQIDINGLLQRADVAVRATRSGEDEVRRYVPSMGQIFMRRFQLVTQLRQALEEGQVSVHYQPKVSLPSRHVRGVEALVRWDHPEFGKLQPDEFVPAIEAAGLIGALTSFVLEEALARVRTWLDEGLRISAAVNLSVRILLDAEFPEQVAEALERFRVPPELLTLELTESGVMSNPQRALPILRELHALGVILAVDDFGTGYSSLAYLRQLPVDEVKIDKSFVLGMGTDLGDLAVVRSIVELGHSLGLTVVAEGVEEDMARDQLESMGCDVAQGYLISRPLSEQRLEAWLRARTARDVDRQAETVVTLLN